MQNNPTQYFDPVVISFDAVPIDQIFNVIYILSELSNSGVWQSDTMYGYIKVGHSPHLPPLSSPPDSPGLA